jgi:hypothetical protein
MEIFRKEINFEAVRCYISSAITSTTGHVSLSTMNEHNDRWGMQNSKEIMWEIEVLHGKKVKISLLQAVEAPRVARGRGSHIS